MNTSQQATWIDAHSHHQPQEHEWSIRNIDVCMPALAQPFSTGLHPCFLAQADIQFKALEQLCTHNNCIAVGEIGLDKRSQYNFNTQIYYLDKQLELAATHHKPVIIHCVKAWNELLMHLKPHEAGIKIIIHGFRGKPELAMQLCSRGYTLSFGFKYNTLSVKLCPAHQLLLETDEVIAPIEALYREIAATRGITPQQLAMQCQANLAGITGTEPQT